MAPGGRSGYSAAAIPWPAQQTEPKKMCQGSRPCGRVRPQMLCQMPTSMLRPGRTDTISIVFPESAVALSEPLNLRRCPLTAPRHFDALQRVGIINKCRY